MADMQTSTNVNLQKQIIDAMGAEAFAKRIAEMRGHVFKEKPVVGDTGTDIPAKRDNMQAVAKLGQLLTKAPPAFKPPPAVVVGNAAQSSPLLTPTTPINPQLSSLAALIGAR